MKYTDCAIGRFIEQARSKPWFDDTLFVIVADHCASAAGKTKLPVSGLPHPADSLCAGPAEAGRDRPPGQPDRHSADFAGCDGLARRRPLLWQVAVRAGGMRPENRRAFISNYQELGYLKAGKLVVLGPKQRVDTFSDRRQWRGHPERAGSSAARRGRGLLPECIQVVQGRGTQNRATKTDAIA
ncbi:MAG: hypothetical protein MZV65_02180 [Chromatiales bacterium]|nr:hypothetical protein [Chromatiales bacterium]